jgi:hypothetical protein
MMSRRQALAGIAAASAGHSAIAEMAAPNGDAGPVFAASDPDANHYGAAEGLPTRRPIVPTGTGHLSDRTMHSLRDTAAARRR